MQPIERVLASRSDIKVGLIDLRGKPTIAGGVGVGILYIDAYVVAFCFMCIYLVLRGLYGVPLWSIGWAVNYNYIRCL